MITIKDPKAMTTQDPRWLTWYVQQRRFERIKHGGYTAPSLVLSFENEAYQMGAKNTPPDYRSYSDLITFTRASGGGITNAAGQFEWVGNNVPRITYDPVTLKRLGQLIEEQRTNLLLQSAVLSTQNVTVAAVAHTLSFYGTGTVTLSGAATGSKVGSGAYPARSSLTFTPTAGTLTLTVTGSVAFAQLESGSTSTSYIPTTTSQVTRAEDVCSVNTLSPWYNPMEGTLVVEFVRSRINICGFAGFLGAANSMIALESGIGAPDLLRMRVLDAGVSVATPNASNTSVAGVRYKMAGSYKANAFAASVNGGTPGTDSSGTVPAVTSLRIGRALDGAQGSLNGTISRITYYPRVIDVQQASA